MNQLKKFFHQSRRYLASKWLSLHPGLKVIGVTGSYGKTNTSTAIAAVLSEKFKTLQTDLNLDTNYNIPITALKLRGQDYGIFELGVDHIGEMNMHLEIVKPVIGVLTGISPVHSDLEHLGSLENIIKEKGKLLEVLPQSGLAIINYDDQNARKMAEKAKCDVWFYGQSRDECQVYFEKPKTTLEGTTVVLHHRWESVEVRLKLVGTMHAYTAAAAAAVGISQGMSLLEIAKGLEKLVPLAGRMSVEKGPNESTLLNDARRANPASTIAGLETVGEIEAKRKILILGQMGELGDYEEKGHRDVGRKVAEVKPDFVVTVGPLTRYIVEEATKKLPKSKVVYTRDVFEAATVLKEVIKKDDLVYMKGSLLKHLERIPLIMQGKKVDPDEVASHRYEIYT